MQEMKIIMTEVDRDCPFVSLKAWKQYMDAHDLEELEDVISKPVAGDKVDLYASMLQEDDDKTKKTALICLAHVSSPPESAAEALKALEKYCQAAPAHLKVFAYLALDESRQWQLME
jgi:hypothetical protein